MRYLIAICLFAGLSYAGTTTPASHYEWQAGWNVTLLEGDLTLTNGDLAVTGTQTHDGVIVQTPVASHVKISTTSTNVTISDNFMVFYSSGSDNGTSVSITPSGVLFSTSAYSVGTRFVAMCSSGTIVLTDGNAYGLSLGAATRTLGACDLIELILRPAYGTMNRLWNEINFVNGDDD